MLGVTPVAWMALLTSAELGCGYGITLVFGLTEVAGLARPQDLAGLTGVFQVACYTGFAAPILLSLLQSTISAPAPVLLLCTAVLAALTLAFTSWQAQRTRRDKAPRADTVPQVLRPDAVRLPDLRQLARPAGPVQACAQIIQVAFGTSIRSGRTRSHQSVTSCPRHGTQALHLLGTQASGFSFHSETSCVFWRAVLVSLTAWKWSITTVAWQRWPMSPLA